MTESKPTSARARISPAGLMFLAVTSVGWGFNWPIMKHILTEWPPLSTRGWTGVAGGTLLAILAVVTGQNLRVPAGQWPRLLLSAFLNVTTWMTLMGLALVWLPANEAVVLAYTMPIWTALLAWPLLRERMSATRILALLMAFAGVAALTGADGFEAGIDRLPGIAMVLVGAFIFGLGTITAKRLPLAMPLISSTALQIGLGCIPVAVAGLVFEHPNVATLSPQGWAMMAYMVVIQFCVGYVCWFAALARLPASVAAIGTMAVPVIGVVASSVGLHEPLGPGQIAALIFTLAGVALATRS